MVCPPVVELKLMVEPFVVNVVFVVPAVNVPAIPMVPEEARVIARLDAVVSIIVRLL